MGKSHLGLTRRLKMLDMGRDSTSNNPINIIFSCQPTTEAPFKWLCCLSCLAYTAKHQMRRFIPATFDTHVPPRNLVIYYNLDKLVLLRQFQASSIQPFTHKVKSYCALCLGFISINISATTTYAGFHS